MTLKMTHSSKSPQSKLEQFSFVIVGLARNCENTIRADIQRIKNATQNAKSIAWLIVESDSTDRTVLELEKLQAEIEDFHFTSLGNLASTRPKRTDRIAYCRNYYAKQIKTNKVLSSADYVVVVDLDGLNDKITQQAFETCWNNNDWDMCSANQDGPYYDIWALRHRNWCPDDCWALYKSLDPRQRDQEQRLWESVYSKMITVPQNSDWIEVDSAFGGLAVYKMSAFDECEYTGLSDIGEEVCEHVSFHLKLKEKGAKLYINPGLINAGITEHTAALQFKNSVRHSYANLHIILPPDHRLPEYQRNHPEYDRFLPHLGKYLNDSDLVVDVGANVGDTMAAMYDANSRLRFICIEPDNRFYGYLTQNIALLKQAGHKINVKTVKALVGDAVKTTKLEGEGGTKHAVVDHGGDIHAEPLDKLLENVDKASVRVLKTDVDGFDYDVLDSSSGIIEASKPIIFFELHFQDNTQHEGYLNTISQLDSTGYKNWFLFDNFGGFIQYTRDPLTIEQMSTYILKQNIQKSTRTIFYLDILATHDDDAPLIFKALETY
jgi:FkbM family methyltransferase